MNTTVPAAPAHFGEVTYEGGTADQQSASSSPNGQHDTVSVIDPNDSALTSEVLTDNAEGDAYAVPPPLPDGKWRAKLRQVDIKDQKGQPQRYIATLASWVTPPVPFLCTNVESIVIDHSGKFDGTKLTDYWVKTLPNKSGTSPVATILRKLGVDLTKHNFQRGVGKFTQQELMALFLSKLAGEPELVIETAWDASCQTCQETAKKKGERSPKSLLVGMHRFPQLRTGGHDPVIKCAICSSSVRAQARIVQYHSLDVPHNK